MEHAPSALVTPVLLDAAVTAAPTAAPTQAPPYAQPLRDCYRLSPGALYIPYGLYEQGHLSFRALRAHYAGLEQWQRRDIGKHAFRFDMRDPRLVRDFARSMDSENDKRNLQAVRDIKRLCWCEKDGAWRPAEQVRQLPIEDEHRRDLEIWLASRFKRLYLIKIPRPLLKSLSHLNASEIAICLELADRCKFTGDGNQTTATLSLRLHDVADRWRLSFDRLQELLSKPIVSIGPHIRLELDDTTPGWYVQKHGRRFLVTISKTPMPPIETPEDTRNDVLISALPTPEGGQQNPTPPDRKGQQNPTPLILGVCPSSLREKDLEPSFSSDATQGQGQDIGACQPLGEVQDFEDKTVTKGEAVDALPADTVDSLPADPEPESEAVTPAQALDALPVNTSDPQPIDSEPKPEPIPKTPADADPPLPPPAISSMPDGDLPRPDWDRMTEADLHAMPRLDLLYEQVIAREILPRSQSTRLDFVTAAVRAREEGDNPPALFRTLVTQGLWAHATGEQEDKAHAMLKTHDWGPPPPLHVRLVPKAVPPPALSADAKTVETVRKWLRTEQYRGDPFHAFKRFAEARDWDRARWRAACDELDTKGIQDRGR